MAVREEIAELTKGIGGPFLNGVGLFGIEDIEQVWNTAIAHYKDSVLKEVGEPFGVVKSSSFDYMKIELERHDNLPAIGACVFTSDAIIAATKPLEEEKQRDKLALAAIADEWTAERAMWKEQLKAAQDQLATAEQRVAEACAYYVESVSATHANYVNGFGHMAEDIRSGEWKKFRKGE